MLFSLNKKEKNLNRKFDILFFLGQGSLERIFLSKVDFSEGPPPLSNQEQNRGKRDFSCGYYFCSCFWNSLSTAAYEKLFPTYFSRIMGFEFMGFLVFFCKTNMMFLGVVVLFEFQSYSVCFYCVFFIFLLNWRLLFEAKFIGSYFIH